MTFQAPKTSSTRAAAAMDKATNCTRARSLLAAFFDWCGIGDCRAMNRWHDRVTAHVLAGMSPEDAAEQAKQAWYRYRESKHLPKVTAAPSREAAVALTQLVQDIQSYRLQPAQAATILRAMALDHPVEPAIDMTLDAVLKLGDNWKSAMHDDSGSPWR